MLRCPGCPRAPGLRAMIPFIVRRLVITVFLLLVVSMITFAIFFLVPRLAGQNSYQLAVQYVGRNPTPAAVHAIERKLGFDQPLVVQYGRFVRGIVLGAHYDAGPDKTYCPRPCSGWCSAPRSACSRRSGAARFSTAPPWASRWPAYPCRFSSPGWSHLSYSALSGRYFRTS